MHQVSLNIHVKMVGNSRLVDGYWGRPFMVVEKNDKGKKEKIIAPSLFAGRGVSNTGNHKIHLMLLVKQIC